MANNVEIIITAVDQASGVLDGIGSSLGKIGSVALGVAAAGIGAVTAALGVMVVEGSKAQDVQQMFNSVLATSPLAGYKDQLLELADAYSKTTRFEDEAVLSAETVLLRYQNLGQDVMPLAVKTTLNLATVMGTDATNAAEQLGKSLEDIAGGSLSLLARTRLLTAEQKDQAVEMAKAGDAAGAQAFVLDILDKKVGNLATDMGGTFTGRMEIFKNTMQNIAEDMGMKLLPALEPLLTKLTDLALKVAPILTDALVKYVIPAITSLVGWLTTLGSDPRAQQIMAAIADGARQIGEAIQPVIDEWLPKFVAWFEENSPAIAALLDNIVFLFVNVLVPGVVGAVKIILAVIDTILPVMLAAFSGLIRVAAIWSGFWAGLVGVVNNAVAGIIILVQGALGFISSLISAIASIPKDLGNFFGDLGNGEGRAFGGDVYAGRSYVVGERGPERFVPLVSGHIYPNDRTGGGSKSVTINITGILDRSMIEYLAQEVTRAQAG